MISREAKARVIIISLVVVVSTLLVAGSYAFSLRNKEAKEGGEITENAEGLLSNYAPIFVNLPPTRVLVGENYYYDIQISDKDNSFEDLSLELIEGPTWLEIKSFVLYGVPTMQNVGNSKVVLRLSDGVNDVEKVFYITVIEEDDGEDYL